MNIELKKIRYYPAISEETNAFVADLYIDSSYIGEAANDGKGGATYVMHNKPAVIKAAVGYFQSLPMKLIKNEQFGDIPIQPSLENEIDELVDKEINAREAAKFNKRMLKEQEDKIIVGIAGKEYMRYYRFRAPIAQMLTNPVQKKALMECIFNLKKDGKITDTHTVLNTNIPADIINEALTV